MSAKLYLDSNNRMLKLSKKVTKDRPLSHFDIAVIGGGPAGMMAAGRAAELGAQRLF